MACSSVRVLLAVLAVTLTVALAGCGAGAGPPAQATGPQEGTPRTSVPAEGPPVQDVAGNGTPREPATVLLDQAFEFVEDARAVAFDVPAWADVLAVNVTEVLTQNCYAAVPFEPAAGSPASVPRLTVTAPAGQAFPYDVSSVLRCRFATGPAVTMHDNLTAQAGSWQVHPSGRGVGVALHIVVTARDTR